MPLVRGEGARDVVTVAGFCAREVRSGLLVRLCARESSRCWAADWEMVDAAEGAELEGWTPPPSPLVLRRLWASGVLSSCRLRLDCVLLAASMPSWMICARRKAFSFSSTVIWFWRRERALADFSASFAVPASCSFCAISSFRNSTVLSSTVPLLYTYCDRRRGESCGSTAYIFNAIYRYYKESETASKKTNLQIEGNGVQDGSHYCCYYNLHQQCFPW